MTDIFLNSFLWVFVWAPLLLLVLYVPFIQHERGGMWRAFKLIGVVAYPLNVLLNYTVFSVYLQDKPQDGERTLSKRIELRLQFDAGWRGHIARALKWLLNKIAPHGDHIP